MNEDFVIIELPLPILLDDGDGLYEVVPTGEIE